MVASRGPPLLRLPALALVLLLPILLLLVCSAAAAYAGAEGNKVLRQVVGRRDVGDGGNFFGPFNVIIGGKRRMLVSAGLHYPRATAEWFSSLVM